MLSHPFQANPDAVLSHLLKIYGSPFTAQEVTNQLNIHPDYPTLLALSDVLANFGVASAAYHIIPQDLPEVPCPFIAHTGTVGTEFVLVKGLNDRTVSLADHKRDGYTVTFKKFAETFAGVVLVPDGVDEPVTDNKALNGFSFEATCYPLASGMLLLALAAGLVFFSPVYLNWQTAVAGLCKTAGLTISVLLLVQSIDRNNPLVQTLCGAGGGKTNCNAILSSKAANVFEGLTWSEVGFFYFAGTWLALLLSRAEMKNVLGGKVLPASGNCTNACGGSTGTCADGETCKSQACPGEPEFHPHCMCKVE